MTAHCPACGAASPPGKRFCGDCGESLSVVCPACGADNPPDKRFCGDCGHALTPATAPPSGHATPPSRPPVLKDQLTAFKQALPPAARPQIFTQEEGENRLLTILFADLSGSTRATLALPPEDAATLLQDVLQAMVDAVVAHGGRINQALGDGVLAFFGTPLAHENDPERAIRAALQLREAVQGQGLNVTVGINSGEVYLGGRGPRQEVQAVGAAINLAARLQQKAQPGQILVGASVYGPTRRAFEFAWLEVEAKGFAEPVAAYEVLRPLPRAEKVRGVEGLHAALMGRDEELGKLTGALEAVQAGQGQIVTIIGEAGVGKSRLIAELKELALAPVTGEPMPLWLEGRCLDIGMAVSYWPFLDLLRAYCGFLPQDDERARGERLLAALQALVAQGALAPERSQQMLPLLGQLLAARCGSALDERLRGAGPEQLKQQTFLTLRDLCVALARCRPLILVLEDLHWADSLSLDLVSLLMEALTLGSLFLVCIYRPERAHKCWHLGAIATRKCPERYTELLLRELTPAQSRRLVENLLHGEALPAPVKEQILARTQGNPFFVEEVVRSLIDAGLVYHDGRVWRARAEIAEVAVPESVQAVILSRVDRLDQETKRVLQCAAVIGRLFRRRLLEHLVRQETALDRALAELEDRQLIYAERAVPEEEYSFQHVLTQEAVYQNLLRRQRAVFHRQVAEGLEELYAEGLEEYYDQLAYHYEQAGAQEKALEYLERAGDRAQAQYANDVAVRYYRDLVDRLDRLGRALEGARGRVKLGTVLTTLARYREALMVLEQAAEVYHTGGDLEGLGHALAALGRAHMPHGTPAEGLARLHEWLEPLEARGPSPSLAAVHAALAELFYISGRYSEQLAAADRALALASTVGDDASRAEAIFSRGIALGFMGCVEEALQVLAEGTRLAEAIGDLRILCRTLGFRHYFHTYRGEFETSRQDSEHWLVAAERQGDPLDIATGTCWQGWTAFCTGAWDQARAAFERAWALGREVGESWDAAWPPLYLGRLCLAEGAWETACTYLQESITLAERGSNLEVLRQAHSLLAEHEVLEGHPERACTRLASLLDHSGSKGLDVTTFVLPCLAWAYVESGEVRRADEVVAQCLTRARGENLRPALADALRVRAMTACRLEQWDDTWHALEEGLALARAMPYPYAEARLLHVYGQIHTQKGEPELALERLAAALAIFRRLGACKDTERVAQAMADLSPSA